MKYIKLKNNIINKDNIINICFNEEVELIYINTIGQ